MDVKTAFLNGVLNENVFMAQPKGFVVEGKENMDCHLKKSIYGLKQASRYLVSKRMMRTIAFMQSSEMEETNRYILGLSQKTYIEKVLKGMRLEALCMHKCAHDLAFTTGMLGRYQSNPERAHWIVAKKFVGYADADWVGCKDTKKSTSRYVFTLTRGVVSWKNCKQSIVASSTMYAEIIACFEATG
ncbi:hypothetical protein U9M48_009020 [Paspalum notatum var. saurae]|uniref:Reverse transcriptase Ty1/copia-type domain-containing protein n=1 Tax=Paspalum notatum var. saurae TaxID=547442 RepID=A0AAQ3SQX1_PASNO